jgi:hypothetical protein
MIIAEYYQNAAKASLVLHGDEKFASWAHFADTQGSRFGTATSGTAASPRGG